MDFLILHADANSFYASCEVLFRPDLRGKPVAVLSNNDGIIIALNAECKKLGFHRGDPFFKVREKCEQLGVAVFSSNYTLYADISSRLNMLYAQYSIESEMYSIDESFLFLPQMEPEEASGIARTIRERAFSEIGVPISIGIASTKTLAKLCNKLAKKHGGTFNWFECNQREQLENYAVKDVWGIGPAKAKILKRRGIESAYELSNMSEADAKRLLTVNGFRTVLELKGLSQIPYTEREKSKTVITCSRSFKENVYALDGLKQALSVFVMNACAKLRKEKLQCCIVNVIVQTVRPFSFTENLELEEKYYFGGDSCVLETYSSSIIKIQNAAFRILEKIYRPGFAYRKIGINLFGLRSSDNENLLFYTRLDEMENRENLVMKSVEKVNDNSGRYVVKPGVASMVCEDGNEDNCPWLLRREKLSPCYTTSDYSLPKVL